MNNISFGQGAGILLTRQLLADAVKLFGKRDKTAEGFFEKRAEELWDARYRQVDELNLTDIYAVRLTNFTVSGSTVSTESEDMTALLDMALVKARKWCAMAFGIGRVFLIPYVINDSIFLDIIPQSREISLDIVGDEIHGFLAVSDVRVIGKRRYARLTDYHFDSAAGTFVIANKAVQIPGGAEVPLSTVDEWQSIAPHTVVSGVDRPLFAVVDCPRDNRDSDRMQGAPITYGCEWIEREIIETLRDYQVEYRHKVSILGIEQTAIDKNNIGCLPREYIKTNTGGRLGESSDLFSVYSPDIRSQPYHDRLLDLFSLHEKMVGTSKGILTTVESNNATATEVRRSMYDTFAIVQTMRENIVSAFEDLARAFEVWLDLLGKRVIGEYSITWDWNKDMVSDHIEELNMMIQLHSIDVVSDVEMRRLKYPYETPEEAQAAIDEIKASKPDPFAEAFPVETFREEQQEPQEQEQEDDA